MKVEDYKHTWVIPRDTWYIKFYCWLWDASPDHLTFCRLFWGYAMAWLALPFQLFVFKPLEALGRLELRLHPPEQCEHGKRLYGKGHCTEYKCMTIRTQRRDEADAAKDERKRQRALAFQNSIPVKVMTAMASGVSWLVMHWPIHVGAKRWKALGLCVCVPLGAIVGWAIGYGVIAMVNGITWSIALIIVEMLGVLIGGVSLFALFMITFILVFSRGDHCLGAGAMIGRGTKTGALKFRDVMRIGYVSVKGNTCPRVVVSKEE